MYQFQRFLWEEFDLGQTEGCLADGKRQSGITGIGRAQRFYQGQGPEKTSTFYEHWKKIWTS